jgi:hypothetical protein
MHKAILMLLLLVTSSSAVAAWVKVGSNETVTIYAHPNTIRKTTVNKVKMWSLYDYNTAQEPTGSRPYMSMKFQDEYNCKEEQSRILYTITHSENMGGGRSLYGRKHDMVWTPISPGSIFHNLWKFACGQRYP